MQPERSRNKIRYVGFIGRACTCLMCLVLFVFGFAKLFLSGGMKPGSLDPIFQMPEHTVGTLGATFELFLAIWLAWGDSFAAKMAAVWLGGVFLLYHIFARLIDPGFTCPCLGSEFWRLGIHRDAALFISEVAAVLFTAAACGSAFIHRRFGPRPDHDSPLRTA